MLIQELLEHSSECAVVLFKALEAASLAGGADAPEDTEHVLAEKQQLQMELQRSLQEVHQKELHFQQVNSKVTKQLLCKSELPSTQK